MEARLLAAANALAHCSNDGAMLRSKAGEHLPEGCDIDAVSATVLENMAKIQEAGFAELDA